MIVEFRCEKCGKLLSMDAEPGSSVKCTQCGKMVEVPAALAAMPRPHVPGAPLPAVPPSGVAAGPPGEAPPEGEEEEEEPSEVMGKMAVLMPWVISLFLHLGIFLIMLFLVMMAAIKKPLIEVLIPDSVLSEDPGGRMDPGAAGPVKSDAPSAAGPREFSRHEAALSGGSETSTNNRVSLIGIGSEGGGGVAGFGVGGGGGSGGGPRSSFYGSGGNAFHIIYLVDKSGSMVDTFDYVRREMLTSISRLKETQDFHILLFSDGPVEEFNPRQMVPAINSYKGEAATFLEKVQARSETGSTDPTPAITRAFQCLAGTDERGKLMYLLTDGVFANNAKVMAAVEEGQKRCKAAINTYLYGSREKIAEEFMQKVSTATGGKYRYIPNE